MIEGLDRGHTMTGKPTAAPLTRKDIEAKIVALAWQDDDFRSKFVADPKRQFEERLGMTLPESLKMTAHQEDENSLHFVIPMRPQASIGELSDEDLEKVAGGTDVVILTVTLIGTAIVALSSVATSAMVGAEAGW
jgi:hypothetical protein